MSDTLAAPTTLALLQASQADAGKNLKDLTKIEDAAQEFEAVFIAEMMKPMFENISTEAPFGGGKGEEIFRALLLDEYGKLVARTGSIGLAAQVKEEMVRTQEKTGNERQTANE